MYKQYNISVLRLLHDAKLHNGTRQQTHNNDNNHFPTQTRQTYMKFAVDFQKITCIEGLSMS